MKKGKGKFWLLIVLAAILFIGSVAYLISTASMSDDVETAPEVGWVGIAIAAVCVVVAFVQKSKTSAKTTHTVEATFTSIGKFGDGWVGCYFEVDGKETRIPIFNSVYNPKLLMPGAKYKLTLKNKDNSVVEVERIG
ncbi:MAG: hypothetical protein J1F66_02455 [Clostridiales bacterium]|nr:hypothetical protein [Clostridiales bacterium]